MAILERREEYSHATIDISDMTVTEYLHNGTRTYSIKEILDRWNGIPDIEINIRKKVDMPETRGEDICESKI